MSDKKPPPENLGKVALGNEFREAAARCNEELQRSGLPYVELLDAPKGSCRTCGCPVDQMPMIFRGTGWCSDRCRKQLQKEEG